MNYSGIKCLHPRRIFKDGRFVTVRCGHCEHCAMIRSSRLKMLCDFEKSCSKQCFFVTLTYAEDNLPMLECKETNVYFDKSKRRYVSSFDCYNISPRLAVDCIDVEDCYLGSFSMVKRDFIDLWQKSAKSYKGHWRPRFHMPYLHPADAQLFLKRLRYYINQYNLSHHATTKLRYYALGEYTPKRFRPHWHFLFFLDQKISSALFKSYISKSWQYGTVNIALVQSNATDYVTTYSCGVNLVSPVHSLPGTKPRVLHSINFGGQIFDGVSTDISGVNAILPCSRYDIPDTLMYGSSDKYTRLWIFGDMAYRRFPKCPRFAQMSHRLRCLSYGLYSFVTLRYGQFDKVSDYAKLICSDLPNLLSDNSFRDLFYFFSTTYNNNPNYPCTDSLPWVSDAFYSSIYTTLLCSRKFLCLNYLSVDCLRSVISVKRDGYNFDLKMLHIPWWLSEAVARLERIYDDYYFCLLSSFYESLEVVSKSESFDTYKSCFYDDFLPDDCSLSPTFNAHCASRVDLYNEKRKHRVLNEANDRFCYDKYDPNFNLI